MQHLRKINSQYYEILGEPESKAKRFICTTPETRQICNRPEILGCEYTDRMAAAMTTALKHLPVDASQIREHESCVIEFLRGGLNFNLRNALHVAYGFNTHSTSFLSSQRFRHHETGRWGVREDMYRKWTFPEKASIFIGDVVATGVTAEQGLETVLSALESSNSQVRNLFFFTIGCHKIEKILDRTHGLYRERFRAFQNIYVIYFEGKFRLADSRTRLRIKIPGTDLLRTEALLAPEFALSQYEAMQHCLERCSIYDAGSRAFDIPEYRKDVCGYWEQLRALAEKGMTLRDAVHERWPEQAHADFASFAQEKRQQWHGIDDAFLKRLYEAQRKREQEVTADNTAEALAQLCEERISTLNSIVLLS